MNINYRQPQFELFPANSSTLDEVHKPRFLLANLSLSIESLVIFVILGIMLALFSFSLGVERGKHLSAQALDERVSAAWNLAGRKPVLPVTPSVKQSIPASRNKSGNAGFIAPSKLQSTVSAAVVGAPAAKTLVPAKTKVIAQKLPAGRFIIQAATNKNEAYARDEALKLKAKGLSSFLIKKGDFWLVCVGPFATQDNANVTLKKMQSKYPGSSVRRF